MPALGNPQHEQFCRLLSAGKTPLQAYEMAGFSPDASNAGKLARRPAIAARASELQDEALKRQGVSADDVLAKLVSMAFVDMTGIAADGTAEEGHEFTPAQLAAATCIEVTRGKNGRVVRVKHDKMPALELLARHYGIGRGDPQLHLHAHAGTALPIDEIRNRIAKLAQRSGTLEDGGLTQVEEVRRLGFDGL